MGQEDVKEWLCKQEKLKPRGFHTVAQIGKAVNNKDNVYRYVNKLYAFGYLDVKVLKYIPLLRVFRIKTKYYDTWLVNTLKAKTKTPRQGTTLV